MTKFAEIINDMKHFFLFCGACLCATLLSAQVIYIDNGGKQEQSNTSVFTKNAEPELYLKPVALQSITLKPSLFTQRYELNKKYLLSLEPEKLLQNFYYEAGISKTGYIMLNKDLNVSDFYWGWESPNNQLRGHFLGHWLSAMAYLSVETGDAEIRAKADKVVAELAECQRINGGKWCGSVPEKYLDLMVDGRSIWSPQYTLHKTLMGLWDMYEIAGSEQALVVLTNFADWFVEWTQKLIAEGKSAAIYRGETSGMLEIWANLYGLTGEQKYADLMQCYGNPDIFQKLSNGEDALSCEHANASIPWSHGAAKSYEVTGNSYWKELTEAFWKNAVLDRESFCTGGQNAGEHWIPAHKLEQFIGLNNQEHCTVYNMMRTADYLLRFSGDISYADYIERNLYNGILAQQNPYTGMVAYFLPMEAGHTKGGEKGWGTPTMDFYCCHGSLVQAQANYLKYIYYENADGLLVSQYIPSELQWQKDSVSVVVSQDFEGQKWTKNYDGNRWTINMSVTCEKPVTFALQFRLPWWLKEKAKVTVNGESVIVSKMNGIQSVTREWHNDEIVIEFPTKLYTEQLSGSKDLYAFMEGPIVLAAKSDGDVFLKGNASKPESMLLQEYDQEYKLVRWTQTHYHSVNQQNTLQFVPLYEIADEKYAIYIHVKK